MNYSTKYLIISGRVQGVGFRAFVQHQAQELGIKGWVRNRPDGKVEIVINGDQRNLDDIISKIRKGPRWAQVDNVIVNDWNKEENFTAFHVRF